MSSPVRLIAGPKAYEHIYHNGLRANDIRAMLGASGGPKWFVLSHLDRYLAGDFFAGRKAPLDLFGTSAGAWRFACYCQNDPVAATTRFVKHYAETVYSEQVDATEITDKAEATIDQMLGPKGAEQIPNHPHLRLHFVVARARHFAASQRKYGQMLGLAIAAGSNAISRQWLPHSFERLLFHSKQASMTESPSPFLGLTDYPTREFELTPENIREALMATGSIPIALHPRRYIPGPGQGSFMDGGVIDYHFDLPIQPQGLVLYPHFYPHVIPGWFDKGLTWRKANPMHYENVFLMCPSPSFVAALPYGKISDRKDFNQMTDEQRLPYWKKVIDEGERLAEFFAERVEKQDWMNYLELMTEPSRG